MLSLDDIVARFVKVVIVRGESSEEVNVVNCE